MRRFSIRGGGGGGEKRLFALIHSNATDGWMATRRCDAKTTTRIAMTISLGD